MAKAIRACIVQNYRRNHYSEGVNKKCLTPSYQFVIVLHVSKSVRSETMDTILKRSYLYDFYGELLTEHQKEIYDGYVNQDLSMTEIADEYSISKQAVSSIVKRCDEALQEYEDKLQLVHKFLEAKDGVQNMVILAEAGKSLTGDEAKAQFDLF